MIAGLLWLLGGDWFGLSGRGGKGQSIVLVLGSERQELDKLFTKELIITSCTTKDVSLFELTRICSVTLPSTSTPKAPLSLMEEL